MKVYFVSIPRTGHTSVRKSLEQDIVVDVGPSLIGLLRQFSTTESRGRYMRQKAGKQWRKHGSFTIIRNPYGRAVSSWKWVKSKTGKDSYGGFKSYLDKLIRGQIKDNMALWHATSQLRHITDASGSYLVDRILRQEKLQQDYDQLRSWLGLGPKQLPHHNKSGYKSYKSFYDDECREMVQQLYSEDIARFNYQY